jgi:hypothetical protein
MEKTREDASRGIAYINNGREPKGYSMRGGTRGKQDERGNQRATE